MGRASLFKPNTHRRSDADATHLSSVKLSRVGGVYGIRNKLATVSTSLNKFADSEVELRRVGTVNALVGSRDPIYNFLCC